jgi:hypothetical protein
VGRVSNVNMLLKNISLTLSPRVVCGNVRKLILSSSKTGGISTLNSTNYREFGSDIQIPELVEIFFAAFAILGIGKVLRNETSCFAETEFLLIKARFLVTNKNTLCNFIFTLFALFSKILASPLLQTHILRKVCP